MEQPMMERRNITKALRLGFLLGALFGVVNMMSSWLFPLADDTVGALLRFYGPMFFFWALASFRAARIDGRLLSGVTTGAIVAFATFSVFVALNILRINLLLYDLVDRADWQNMMARFEASGADSLRTFVTLFYITDAPLKIGTAAVIGALMGAIGGSLGRSRLLSS
jgi:hypothetical protein